MRLVAFLGGMLIFAVICVGCSRESSRQAQGYIEGRYTYMATNVSGRLKELLVNRGERVKQGQKLFVLEAQPESDTYQAAQQNLEQAIAAREVITANLAYAKVTYEHNKILVTRNAIQKAALDNAKATFDATTAQFNQAQANIASLEATLAQSKWMLQQKTTYAPFDALVFDTYYRLGEYTVENQAILSLLVPSDIKAIFYVNAPALGFLRLNDKVEVHCDRCPKIYTGYISFISPVAEYTPPVIYSSETNEKLVFRIEARFTPEDAYQLHPGQPVSVTYSSIESHRR